MIKFRMRLPVAISTMCIALLAGAGSTVADAPLESLDGYVTEGAITPELLLMVGQVERGRMYTAVAIQEARGVRETGLQAAFIGDARCPRIDSEKWAIDYSQKRPFPALHKGVDIPQPSGTPILAIADGTVIGKFENRDNRKGIEIMLRHTPEQTGLPFWVYSQYTHLREMSPLPIGATVEMGQEIGKTSNTGKSGRNVRRDALHFALLYSAHREWTREHMFIIPKDGRWMDPNAFYRRTPPYDSDSLAALPAGEKETPVPYLNARGVAVPPDTKRIWPYRCAE
jgi:murein DD-endopeptidase MepM/ murein hydrolase activator NlpD